MDSCDIRSGFRSLPHNTIIFEAIFATSLRQATANSNAPTALVGRLYATLLFLFQYHEIIVSEPFCSNTSIVVATLPSKTHKRRGWTWSGGSGNLQTFSRATFLPQPLICRNPTIPGFLHILHIRQYNAPNGTLRTSVAGFAFAEKFSITRIESPADTTGTKPPSDYQYVVWERNETFGGIVTARLQT